LVCVEASKRPIVSILIVNFNGEKYLRQLFESLSNQTFTNFEIIVVDNASHDNSLGVIEEIFKHTKLDVIFLKNETNLGFCISNNQALKRAQGSYVVFLNNDTFVSARWLEELVKTVESKDNIAAVVSCIINKGSALADYGNFYDIYGASLERTVPNDRSFFYGCGASLLIRKQILERIGGLDEELFMYQDDPDLCWRLRLLGQTIGCAIESVCHHLKQSPSILEANMKMPVWEFYYAHPRNRIRIIIKNYSFRTLFRRLPIVIFLIQMRALLLTFLNKNPGYLVAFMKGLLWNGLMLSSTLRERYRLQSMRSVDDKEVEKFMLPYSIELSSLKDFLA
jgi:GT2 family glycosyltransferase